MVAALRVQMLDDISGEFDPITDADSNYGRVIGIKVASRTNPSIAEDMDVSPERKARVQVRCRERGARCLLACMQGTRSCGREKLLANATTRQLGTANGAMRHAGGLEGAKKVCAALRAQMLDDISSEFDPISDADSNYGRVIGIKVASRTNPAIAEDMDVSPERKARVQVRSWNRSLSSAKP